MSYQPYVGSTAYAQVRAMLASGFPGQPPSDAAVDAAIDGEWTARARVGATSNEAGPSALAFLPAAPPGWKAPAPTPQSSPVTYYVAKAVHSRKVAPFSEFQGMLPVVRLPLPTSAPTQRLAQTSIGDVFVDDHLLPSVTRVRRYMVREFDASFKDISRVDLVCPARVGARFAAISVYIGYRAGGTAPSFYVLEAGMATGAPVMLYGSPTLAPILGAQTGYTPTPWSTIANTYDGTFTLSGADPARLVVQAKQPGATSPYMVVSVDYQIAASAPTTWPGDLQFVAAERIAAVAQARGENKIGLQAILAPAGLRLPWIKKPQ